MQSMQLNKRAFNITILFLNVMRKSTNDLGYLRENIDNKMFIEDIEREREEIICKEKKREKRKKCKR